MLEWMFNRKKSTTTSFTTTNELNSKPIRLNGQNIAIVNNKIIVDGKLVDVALDSKNIIVIVEGDCDRLSTTGPVEVRGNCGSVDCSGSCSVDGSVDGSIDAGGSITCGNVHGNVDAGGSVTCGNITGAVDAGGNIRCSKF